MADAIREPEVTVALKTWITVGVVLLCAIVAVAMLKKGTVAAGGAH
jgi:hypothetical protein